MSVYGIIKWGESAIYSVTASNREEASRKLEARGHVGQVLEIMNIDNQPASESVRPPKGPTPWEVASEICKESRNTLTGGNGASTRIITPNGRPITIGAGGGSKEANKSTNIGAGGGGRGKDR